MNTKTAREERLRNAFSLRFLRDVRFPRFGMVAGEVWYCHSNGKTGREYLNAIASGADRFPFAGGLCFENAEAVFEWPAEFMAHHKRERKS